MGAAGYARRRPLCPICCLCRIVDRSPHGRYRGEIAYSNSFEPLLPKIVRVVPLTRYEKALCNVAAYAFACCMTSSGQARPVVVVQPLTVRPVSVAVHAALKVLLGLKRLKAYTCESRPLMRPALQVWLPVLLPLGSVHLPPFIYYMRGNPPRG